MYVKKNWWIVNARNGGSYLLFISYPQFPIVDQDTMGYRWPPTHFLGMGLRKASAFGMLLLFSIFQEETWNWHAGMKLLFSGFSINGDFVTRGAYNKIILWIPSRDADWMKQDHLFRARGLAPYRRRLKKPWTPDWLFFLFRRWKMPMAVRWRNWLREVIFGAQSDRATVYFQRRYSKGTKECSII